jgi:hypothetical protein
MQALVQGDREEDAIKRFEIGFSLAQQARDLATKAINSSGKPKPC